MKKAISLILCLVMTFGLVACGSSDTPETNPLPDVQETPTPSETVTDSTEGSDVTPEPSDNSVDVTYREGSAEAAAQKFVKSLLTADYKTAVKCFNVPEDSPYFTAKDVEWYLPRSNYADLLDVTYTDYSITVEKDHSGTETAKCKVTIADKNSDAKKTFSLTLCLDKTNKWGVEDTGFYIKEYYLVVPGGKTTVKIDDIQLEDSYKVGHYGTRQLRDLYKIEYVGKSEKEFLVAADTFETVSEKIYPVENDSEKPYEIHVYYTGEEAYQAVGKLWMTYYQALLDGKTYSDMVDTLSPSADVKTAEVILNGLKSLTNDGKLFDCNVLDVKACADANWTTEYFTSNQLKVCFNYTLNWNETNTFGEIKNKTMKNHDYIMLHYDGETFTIEEISANDTFFRSANEYTDKPI